MIMTHDYTRGDLCGCQRCDAIRTASLADSRATHAIQQAAWHPRSKRLAKAAAEARTERDAAIAALRMHGVQ